MNTTEWFPAEVKPVHVGVYEACMVVIVDRFGETEIEYGFAKWDGERWGLMHSTADAASELMGWAAGAQRKASRALANVITKEGRKLMPFDMLAHLQRQRVWSEQTFGPGARTKGVVDHIRKELCEIEADPTDITEWIDVVILALDGAWRAGATPEQIVATLVAKQTKNENRNWPDWRTADPDKAIEHDRTGEAA